MVDVEKNEELMTIQEVAKLLKITETSVRNMMGDGRLSYRTLPSSEKRRIVRFKRSVVMKEMNIA